MALVALIGDTHFGTSNSNNLFLRYQDEFFADLIPKLLKLGVTDVIHMGDLYDVRKYVNFKTLKRTSRFFTERFMETDLEMHILVGNHDSYNKNTLDINAPRELLGWSRFHIYDSPRDIVIDGCEFFMAPWVCEDNAEEFVHMLDNTTASVCCGHFDIAGFYIIKNVINQHGIGAEMFKKFKKTFSGHFHIPGQTNNVIMVGSPYELNWNDYSDPKRIIIYDTKTNTETYLLTEKTIHEKIFFNSSLKIEKNYYTDKIVKVYVDKNQNSYELDLFMKELSDSNPYSVAVIENIDFEIIDDIQSFVKKDTIEFLVDYIEEMNYSDKEKFELQSLMKDLYLKAKEIK